MAKFTCLAQGCSSTKFHDADLTLDENGRGQMLCTCDNGHQNRFQIQVEKAELVKPEDKPMRTKVSGVTFDNPDGTKRQSLLKYVAAGDDLAIKSESVDGKAMFVVRHAIGVIGTLKADIVKDFMEQNKGRELCARVIQLTGGQGDKTIIGCNIELYAGDAVPAEQAKADVPQPTAHAQTTNTEFVYMDPGRRDIYHADKLCSGMKGAKRIAKNYAEKALKARPCKRCVKTEKEGTTHV